MPSSSSMPKGSNARRRASTDVDELVDVEETDSQQRQRGEALAMVESVESSHELPPRMAAGWVPADHGSRSASAATLERVEADTMISPRNACSAVRHGPS